MGFWGFGVLGFWVDVKARGKEVVCREIRQFINGKVLRKLVTEEIVGNMSEINTTKFQIK